MKYLSTRLISLYIFLFCCLTMAIALYMQYAMRLEPCYLCIMQRVFFIGAGLVALLAFLHNPQGKGKIFYGLATTVMAIAGSGFAFRQIYLQHLPKDQIPTCGPSIGYMLEEYPFMETLSAVLKGDGNCAEIVWVDPLFGLGIPQLAIIAFAMIAAAGLYQAFRK